jgi:hypothetical protein
MTIAALAEARAITQPELTGKTWKIKIIEGDRQGSSAYYPKEALESGKHLFSKGVRIFKNHPDAEEKWSRPERSIDDIIGWLSEDATFDGKDLYANAQFVEAYQPRIKELAEAGVIGMSIRASGEMTEGTNGMELKKFTSVQSVDVVTQAGAGGGFESLLEAARNNNSGITPESQEEVEELEFPKELAEALDNQIKAVNALVEAVTKREEAEAAKVEEAERKAAEENVIKAPNAVAIAEALVEAGLAPKARGRVLAAVEGGADLKESIQAEKDIAAEILEEAAKNSGSGFVKEEKSLSESERTDKIVANVFG